MNCRSRRRYVIHTPFRLILTLLLTAFCLTQSSWAAKNVILMVSDGAGHNTWQAASMFQGKLDRQVYDRPGWLRLSCTTYPLTNAAKPTGDAEQDAALVYDPLRAWDGAVDAAKTGRFPGYNYLTAMSTDSAAAATALAAGRKTYRGAINWSHDNTPMSGQTIAEIAKSRGKAVGVITSVPWSHATPAGLGGAHNVSRGNYAEIAKEMLDAGVLDVIMGAGNPDFDNDGKPIPAAKSRNYDPVGGRETWQALKQGRSDWKLFESKEDFQALTTGPAPAKVLGTAQVAATLQAKRKSNMVGLAYEKIKAMLSPEHKTRLPFAIPMNDNVPTLAVMTKAALNCLDDDPDGFYLMIEGGAVDWANHANEPDRMIEEQIDFVDAVEAVVAWIETHGGWRDTLLILTADHETGLVWGPQSEKIAFQPLQDNGAGHLPGMKHHSHSHSNSLVPLMARGAGSCRFLRLVDGLDATAAAKWNTSGQYVDNTDVFTVMEAEMTAPQYHWTHVNRCRPLRKHWQNNSRRRPAPFFRGSH